MFENKVFIGYYIIKTMVAVGTGWLDSNFYIFTGISFIILGISMLYHNKKKREISKKITLSMIYNTDKRRGKRREQDLKSIFTILFGIFLFICGIISIIYPMILKSY